MLLQCNAYEQLTGNEKISDKYKTSVASQLNEMKKAGKGKVVLVVCDDVCKYSCYFCTTPNV